MECGYQYNNTTRITLSCQHITDVILKIVKHIFMDSNIFSSVGITYVVQFVIWKNNHLAQLIFKELTTNWKLAFYFY